MSKPGPVLFSYVALIVLSGCSAITSTELSDEAAKEKTPRGLTYFMPRKDIQIEIDVQELDNVLQVNNVTISTTGAYADRSKVYVLNHGRNLLADNKLTVKINSAGLLESATATSTSKVEEAFSNLAKSAANVGTASAHLLECTRPGKYTFVLPVEKPSDKPLCGLTVLWRPLTQVGGEQIPASHNQRSDKAQAGLYYRQDRAYLVTVTQKDGDNILFHISTVVSSPSESNALFLPVSRSFFADSVATFTLVDGVPTDYDQDDKSELVGGLIVPAKVIGAYFAAAGEVFAAFSTNKANQIALIESEKNLELAKRNADRDLEAAKVDGIEITKKKIDLCIAAIEADKDQLIDDLKCAEL
jgi:hypothetical protein